MKNSTKQTYICKCCKQESQWSHQKMNVYCSIKCSAEGKLQESIDRFKLGQVSERATLRKVLSTVVGYKCSCCGISKWNGSPITLQVDHIDGNAGNNMPENLRLICPNCHSQTDSFSGGNKGSGRKARGLPLR